jgi:type IX secretion system substrate protein
MLGLLLAPTGTANARVEPSAIPDRNVGGNEGANRRVPLADVGVGSRRGMMRRRWQRWKRRVTPMLWAVIAAAPWPAAVGAQAIDPDLWGVDNRVLTLARSASALYVGGAFVSVGPQTGGGVPVNLHDGLAVERYPRVVGEIKTVVPDGAGGWYIGGSFVGVGGVPRSNLAHILPGGSVAHWDPGPNGAVRTLVVHDGTLYVGGDFGEIGGRVQEGIAAFDLATGKLSPWAQRIGAWYAYRYIAAILVHGDAVYIGGAFSSIGGGIRTCLAAIDARTGRPLSWNPVADGQVECLAAHGNVIYVGGYFARIAGQDQRYLASFDMRTGQLASHQIPVVRVPEDCRCDLGPYVSVLVIHGDRIYVGGSFTSIGGKSRGGLAAVDLRSGEVTDWDPQLVFPSGPSPYCRAVVVRGTKVYVGGDFSGMSGRYQVCLGALDARTAEPTAWVPLPNGRVDALALADPAGNRDQDRSATRREDDRERGSGETMYVGGSFTSLGPLVRRTGLAAFDASTGKVLPWDPEPDGVVQSLVVTGNTVHVAGNFSTVGGQPRAHLAALDATTGLATPWNPGVNGPVWSVATGRGVLYVAGWFSSAGGQSRRNIAALDTATSVATSWNPNPNDEVNSVAVGENAIFAGGWFTRIGGALHSTLAALDPVSGAALPWRADCDAQVNAVAVGQGAVYAAGAFNFVNGVPHDALVALDPATGSPLPWLANVDRQVLCVSLCNNIVYAGGGFGSINGQPRSCVAALDGRTGAVLPWNPDVGGGPVWALAAYGDAVYAGGGFSRMGLSAVNGLAAISPAIAIKYKRALPVSVDLGPQGVVTCSVQPNPIQARGLVRFRLPVATTVSLSVYDLQGRCVGTLLNREARPAGEYPVAIRTEAWPEGTYFMRLEAGGLTTTEKFVVVR